MSRVRVRVRVIDKKKLSERNPGRPVSMTKAAGRPRECLGLGLGLLKKKLSELGLKDTRGALSQHD